MALRNATALNRQGKGTERGFLHSGRLNIRPRLMIGFSFIILSMLAADAVILWQFHLVRVQAGLLSDVDQKLVSVLRMRTSVLAFYSRLDALAAAEDVDGLVAEAQRLPTTVLEDVRRATTTLALPPFKSLQDPTITPTLQFIQSALPSQLAAIITLARSGDWRAVHLRIVKQVQPLEFLTSALVEKIDHQAGEQQAQAVLNIRRVERLVFWVVPLTAVFTLLISGALGMAITRSITHPLSQVVEASKALARGEFQHQVAVTGTDELAHLAQVFNDTARRLRDLYNDLQRREAKIRRLVDSNIVGIFIWDLEGQIVEANEAFLGIVGYGRDQLVSGRLRLNDLTPSDWRDRDAQAHAQLQESGSIQPYEKEYFRKDGSRVPVLVGKAVFDDASNEGVAFVLDLTERKRADEQRDKLHQLEAELAHVHRLTMMGELAASLAHEIKQPITAAMTNAETTQLWLANDPPDLKEAREAATRVVNSAARAADIINHLRSLYKKGAPSHRELVDVNEVAREMLVLLRSEAHRFSVSMRTELTTDLPRIEADRVQLQQVFMNLMLNGVEAMRDTGGELTITSKQAEDGKILISIRDNGVGLPTEKIDQIFSPFFTTKSQGTGMGLAITRSIIEAHGGRLWAVANTGRGATFYFALPIQARAVGASLDR